jgi:hypothetical protein
MSGTEPHFRWDSYGITAYDFKLTEAGGAEIITNYDTSKGVRFDRFGIYGFDKTAGLDGAVWKPQNLDDIKRKSIFALTWDGLFLRLGSGGYSKILTYNTTSHAYNEETDLTKPINHSGSAVIGFTDGRIYNDYINDTQSDVNGLPYYDISEQGKNKPVFAKVFSINSQNSEELAIYDDGTLIANKIKLTGSIQWTSASSPSKSVYARASVKELPPNGTKYSDFANYDNAEAPYRWHKKVDNMNDVVYAHTDDGGTTWSGPFLLTGKSVTGSETEYAIATPGLDPSTSAVIGWTQDYPTIIPHGKILYIRTRQIYNNETESSWAYSVGGNNGKDTINCYIESNAGEIFNEKETSKIMLTARIFEGLTEIDPRGNTLTYTWYYNNEKMNGYNTKSIEIYPKDYKQGALYFTADDAKE